VGRASLILFSDGRYVGGTLDRNGLRPSRYLITKDDLIVMGSETGVQSFPDEQIKGKGRLTPRQDIACRYPAWGNNFRRRVKAQLTK
jgi:hypothetical protein